MYCRSCGVENDDRNLHCVGCGEALFTEDSKGSDQRELVYDAPHVSNHLVWAILVTIFCCQPLGVVSVVYAAQVDNKLEMGDYETARKYSKNAAMFAGIGFGVWALMILGYVAFMFVAFTAGAPMGP